MGSSRGEAPNERTRSESKSSVQVAGIEGTLHAYDVRQTMEPRMRQFAQCQVDRVRKVRVLSGEIELGIHVLADGTVSQVNVLRSDLGDIDTEQCLARITQETPFPRPNGGEANVKWNMMLDPLGRGRPPDSWEPEDLAESLELKLPDLAENCKVTRGTPALRVTAYVAPSGKVLAAGASSQRGGLAELMDCVARDVQTWQLPRGPRTAKVTFETRYRRPLNDQQRKAIRKKYARKREAERRARQAEARRKRKKARNRG